MRWDSVTRLLSPLVAPSDPLLCKFADGGPKKRQNPGKFVQNGRAWPRNGDMVRGPLRIVKWDGNYHGLIAVSLGGSLRATACN